jgi:putative ATP-dependent endonuclease of OLD family
MKISNLKIKNFRGIKSADLNMPNHMVLIGDNNTGKSTILESLDLVLGPDRLGRRPVVDEHDFYQGNYIGDKEVEINIEATITGLSETQLARFNSSLEWWDNANSCMYATPPVEGVDEEIIEPALRVTFIGRYDAEEDDFVGETFYTRSLEEGDSPQQFYKRDKQNCGFLYLRSLRTGSRALSLEAGSLLDIILRIREIRPQMWEKTINDLKTFQVADDPALGISAVLKSIEDAIKKYVPKEWGVSPHLKVSSLTREHLRKTITAFVATGEGEHAAPFYRQGTGTINLLVLAMLTLIAEDKHSVIFAMEEPETAIPPYAQKRIIHEVRALSSQAIFTSHSPYVLEEFDIEETLVLSRDSDGVLKRAIITLPDSIKLKRYRHEFRTRFCEGLLSRRVLIAEGATEYASFPVVFQRLSELNPTEYSSLEALGVCTVDAGSETCISDLATLYNDLGKQVFATCDKQPAEREKEIFEKVEKLYMHSEKGFEQLVLKNTTKDACIRYIESIEWPQHLETKYPDPKADPINALADYFSWSKGTWGVSDFLAQCTESEIPTWLKDVCRDIKSLCS